jgi:hypothetical protein
VRLTAPDVQVASSSTALQTVLCGIDADGAAHLMRLLSDLYSNSAAAVLREYSVNALDSHKAAGNPAPVEVTLPSDLNPVLVVTDHGTGLSRDDVIRVYASYGASTKRGSNDLTGAFGLGSKSALTLGSQFIVTAVKGGERVTASFGIGETGAGTVTIMDCRATGEPDGVTVSIAVSDVQAMRGAAGPVFAGWEPGSVLVDGEQPRSVFDDPVRIGEGVYLADAAEGAGAAWGDAGLIVIMGGICYPVSRGLLRALWDRLPGSRCPNSLFYCHSGGQRVFAAVGIGDVDIAPSREEMRDTPRTLGRLERVVAAYLDGAEAAAQREIDAAPTMTAAARKIAGLRHSEHLSPALGDLTGLCWRGRTVPRDLKVPYPSSAWSRSAGRRRKSPCEHERGPLETRLDSGILDSALVITDVPDGKTGAAMRSARAFLTADETYSRLFFAPPGAGPVEWFAFGQSDTIPALPFGEYMKEAKRRRPAPEEQADAVKYTVFTRPMDYQDDKGKQMSIGEIRDLGLPVVVAANRGELSEGPMRFPEFARQVHDGVTAVALTGGRTLAAVRRKLGTGVPVTTLGERADAVAASVAVSWTETDRELDRVRSCREAAGYHLWHTLLELRSRIVNPDVTGVLDRMARYGELTREERRRADLLSGARAQWPALFPSAGKQRSLLEDYPLLEAAQWQRTDGPWGDHVVAYLNAVTRD